MIIKKSAIEEFLKAPRDNWQSWKNLDLNDLEKIQEHLPIHPPIWKKLLRHQKICFLLGTEVRRFAFHLKVGMGKTLVALALIKYFRKIGNVKCTLVLVPNLSNKVEWADEIEKHSPTTKYMVLQGSSKQKWAQIEENQDTLIFVETYAGLSRLVSELVPSKKKRGHNRLKPSRELVEKLASRIDGLVLDESTFVVSRMALPYRICHQLQKRAKIVFTLTGTPFGRNPELLWSQFHLLDQGESLGTTLGLYRAAFFNAKDNGWGGIDYKFKSFMAPALHRCMGHRSISMKPNPADLPFCTRIIKEVRLAKDATSYYSEARRQLFKAKESPQKIQASFVRMRQISSGFLGYKDDVGRGAVLFSPNAKLDMLVDILEKITPGEDKVIIFHEFILSGDMICQNLKHLELNHVRIGGGAKNAENALHSFKNNSDITVLVLNHTAGGFGLNLQVANIGIVFESPVSVIMREQIEARFIRQYSPHKNVWLYDLVAKNTADATILKFAKEGKDLMKAIVEGEVKF